MNGETPYLEKALGKAREAGVSLGEPPGEYLEGRITADISCDGESSRYRFTRDSETYDWLTTLEGNVLHRTADLLLSPLTGYSSRLSGRVWMEGVCLASDGSIDEETDIMVVETPDWRREIEDPEWYDVAETVLDAAEDHYGVPDRFRNGAEGFIEDHSPV